MTIEYCTNLDGINAQELTGFFVGWRSPLTNEQHYQILQNSARIVLAVDAETKKVVGFIKPSVIKLILHSSQCLLQELEGITCIYLSSDLDLQVSMNNLACLNHMV